MTEFTPRDETELVTLEFDDRRRLAVSDAIRTLEATGELHQMDLGVVVLRNVRNEDEILELGDKTTRRLSQMLG